MQEVKFVAYKTFQLLLASHGNSTQNQSKIAGLPMCVQKVVQSTKVGVHLVVDESLETRLHGLSLVASGQVATDASLFKYYVFG